MLTAARESRPKSRRRRCSVVDHVALAAERDLPDRPDSGTRPHATVPQGQEDRLGGRRVVMIRALACRLIVLALACGILIVGIPNAIGQFAALPGNPALKLLLGGSMPSEAGFDRIQRSRDRALMWTENPGWRIDKGAAYLAQALATEREGGDPAALLQQAREQLRTGLSRRPADGVAWLWLATTEYRLGQEDAAALALRMSLTTAPVDPSITLPRASLALLMWPRLDPATRDAAGREMAQAAEHIPQDLIVAADDVGRRQELRAALANDPEASEDIEQALRRMRGLP